MFSLLTIKKASEEAAPMIEVGKVSERTLGSWGMEPEQIRASWGFFSKD